MKIRIGTIFVVAMVSIFTFVSDLCFANIPAMEFIRSPKLTIKAKIGRIAPTRISFGKYPIAEVIGDESKYKIIGDKGGFNIFITPNVPAGEIIPLHLITTNNQVQSLLLEVGASKTLPQSILITEPKSNTSNLSGAQNSRDSHATSSSDAALMLKAMMTGDNAHGKYYVTFLDKKISIPSLKKLSIVQDKTWRFKDLTGASLKVTNESKKQVILQEEDFSQIFKNTLLSGIESNLLPKNTATRAFIVTREASNDR